MSGDTFVRFVVAERDSRSGYRRGLIHAAERGRLQFTVDEEARCLALFDWFNANLRVPRRFARAGRANPEAKALSWYRDSAIEHIGRMWELAAIVRQYEPGVTLLRTERPGFIVYEDKFQVAAEPFADTPT